MKKILFTSIILALLISCKKSSNDENFYTVTGLVLDWDDHTLISGAKVYGRGIFYNPATLDSAISDANGIVSFRFKNDGSNKYLQAIKQTYLQPYNPVLTGPPSGINRTDTLFLARPSNLNFTMHRANTYLGNDNINLIISSYPYSLYPGSPFPPLISYELMRPANATDTTFLLPFVYYPLPNYKVSLILNVLRNGSIIDRQVDTTDLIQFGTRNYTLNY